MSDTTDFQAFSKIPRLRREMVVTEKIDGTNAQVYIAEDGYTIRFGSRSKWLSSKDDNYGFWHWGNENTEELLKLGPGRHFGEWWGSKIQRNYGLTNGERHFSLFNTSRWNDDVARPMCCRVVPTLYVGEFSLEDISYELHDLKCNGSRAQLGFMQPEGIVVFHTAANMSFKVTIEGDEKPKGSTE